MNMKDCVLLKTLRYVFFIETKLLQIYLYMLCFFYVVVLLQV